MPNTVTAVVSWVDGHATFDYTVKIDLEAVRAYHGLSSVDDIDDEMIEHITDEMIRDFIRDQQEYWTEQVDIDSARTHTLDEINVIS